MTYQKIIKAHDRNGMPCTVAVIYDTETRWLGCVAGDSCLWWTDCSPMEFTRMRAESGFWPSISKLTGKFVACAGTLADFRNAWGTVPMAATGRPWDEQIRYEAVQKEDEAVSRSEKRSKQRSVQDAGD